MDVSLAKDEMVIKEDIDIFYVNTDQANSLVRITNTPNTPELPLF